MFDGIAAASAECATAKLPAVWGGASSDTIDVFVKRYPATQRPAKGQLWMLARGLSFLANPSAAPDTSCIAQMLPLDFGSPPAKWMAAVGIEDLWANP